MTRARALALAASVSLVGCLSRPMIFPGCDEALPAPATRLETAAGAARVVGYASADGVLLRGALFTAPPGRDGAPRRVVVYFHGNAESAAENLPLGRALAARGVDVLLAEYRGYGGCPGSPSEDGLLADARAAVAFAAREAGVPEARVVLVGRSLGTGVAAAMAAEGRGRAVVLLSPYTSILDLAAALVSRPVAWLAVIDTFPSLEWLLAARQPVWIVHGTRDEVIPFAHGEAIAAALGPARCTLRPAPGLGHNDLFVDLQEIVDDVVRVTSTSP